MSRAAAAIADAVATVIAARIVATLHGVPAELAAEIASGVVHDLSEDGWYITAFPTPLNLSRPERS